MTVFVDTSAMFALLDADDLGHPAAAQAFRDIALGEALVTHSYVMVEMIALTQRRLGADAVRAFARDIHPLLDIAWVDAPLHAAGISALLAALPTAVSLVDMISFHVMRERRITRAFACDDDFSAAGFQTIP